MKKNYFSNRTLPRWVIQVIDLIIVTFTFGLSYFFVKRFEFIDIYRGHFFIYTGVFCSVTYTVFYLMGIHRGLIRFSNIKDIIRIFLAVLISNIVFFAVNKIIIQSLLNINSIDIGRLLFVNFFITSSFLIFLRIAVKEIFLFAKNVGSNKKEKIIIYGADRNSIFLKNALEAEKDSSFEIVGFLDGRRKLKNSYIEQKKVYQLDDLVALRDKQQLEKLMLFNEGLGSDEKKAIIEECLKLGIKIVTLPPSGQWAFGKLSLKQIKNLNIEDLLQREPIKIHNDSILNEVANKRILVTGAAGSIGSELIRQLTKYKPGSIILCDQAESPLHELQLQIKESFPGTSIQIFIGNVQNYKRMEVLFQQCHPNIVFHAAAYKHVPLMENNPSEAVLANVLGTKNIAELACIFSCEKFIMISTDKAVNPTNVMGASKRIAELYVQSLNGSSDFNIKSKDIKTTQSQKPRTKFITTRFGNVLGSNGSVIPRFSAQIQKGGPVTVTDPEITRYFMTIPEAVQLVLEAATMGNGGEIYVFDMGTPVKIVDLARKMIKLAGLEPDRDIKIEFTGMRPGEKLYEELLNDEEITTPTHHEKIKIAKVVLREFKLILNDVNALINLTKGSDDTRIVKKMKEIIPEFLSKNSPFEYLDGIEKDKSASSKKLEKQEPVLSSSFFQKLLNQN